MKMRWQVLALAPLFMAVSACDVRQEPEAKVEDVWVQLPVVAGRPGAAYFTITSNNDPSKLQRITSPKVQKIELHETETLNGVSKMSMIEEKTFPQDLKLVATPGEGLHAMLFGIDPSVKPGAKIPLTFEMEPLPDVTVEAEVRAFGATGHAGH